MLSVMTGLNNKGFRRPVPWAGPYTIVPAQLSKIPARNIKLRPNVELDYSKPPTCFDPITGVH